jgi:hypothetical protein
MIDATIVKVHKAAAGARSGSKGQAIGRSRGGLTTKIPINRPFPKFQSQH